MTAHFGSSNDSSSGPDAPSPVALPLASLLEIAVRALDASAARVSLRHDGRFVVVDAYGAPRRSVDADVALDAVPARTGAFTSLRNVDADPRFVGNPYVHPDAATPSDAADRSVRPTPRVRSYVGVPLWLDGGASDANASDAASGGAPVGVLSVLDARDRPLSDDDRDLLVHFAAMVASVVRTDAPRPSALLDHLTDGFYTLDAAWRFTYVNQRAADAFGRSVDDLVGRRLWDVVPDQRDGLAEHELRRALRDGVTTAFGVHFPSLSAWVRVRAHPTADGLAVYFRDVSDRRHRTEQLRLLEKVVENAFESVLVTDAQTSPSGPRIVYVNPAFCEMTGYTAEEVIGETPRLLHGPHTDRRVLDHVRLQLDAGEPVTDETINYRKDGTPFVVQWNIVPVHDAQGEIEYWVSVQRDVTDQRATEEALFAERDLLRGIMETSVAAITVVDAESHQIIFANERAEQILGLERSSIMGRTYDAPEWHITDVDGSPFPEHELPFAQILDTQQPVFDVRHSIEWPNGERRLLSINGAPLFDAEGRLTRVVFSVDDVTERHETEQALREERNLLRGITDTSVAAIAVLDEAGVITFANARMEAIFGRPRTDIVGRHFDDPAWEARDTKDEPLPDAAWPFLRVRRSNTPVHNIEHTVVRPDGEVRWLTINGAPLRAAGSGPHRFVFAIDDVTERHRQQESLRRHRMALEEAQAITQTGNVTYHVATGRYEMSEQAARIYGFAPRRTVSVEAVFDLIHPDDAAQVREQLNAVSAGQASTDIEFRIRPFGTSDPGATRWIRGRGRSIRDDEGTVSEVFGTITDVTERKRNESALERFGRLLDASVNEVYFFASDTLQFVQVSSGVTEQLGYTASELRTMTPLDIEPLSRRDFEQFLAPLRSGEQDQVVFETTHRRKDGSHYPVEVHIQLSTQETPPLFTAIAIDITERKAWEREQWRTTNRVHTLHDIGRAILSASSPETIAQSALERLARTVPFDRASVVEFDAASDRGVILAVTPDDTDALSAGTTLPIDAFHDVDTLSPGAVRRAEVQAPTASPDAPNADAPGGGAPSVDAALHAAGIRSHVSVPLGVEQRTIGVLNLGTCTPGVLQDDHIDVACEVADMLAVALQQTRYEAELVAAKEEAEEMNRLKTAFLANMSHEIRTPLTSIIGFAEIISGDPSAAQEFGDVIRESGERLLRTLNSVLDLAQLEADAFEPEPGLTDVVATVHGVVDDFGTRTQSGVSLTFHAPTTSFVARLDADLLSRILHNLLSNAVKFTDRGSIDVHVDVDDGVLTLQVIDTGVGIDPSFRPHVFDEFKQESTGDARFYEGTGLGLTITKRLVHLMGGDIRVESTKGEGSTFTVKLPTDR